MEVKQIPSLLDIRIENHIREKVIKQANFAGLEQNLETGAIITLEVGKEICQFEFNRDAAIKQHMAPKCASQGNGSNDTNNYCFTNKQELTVLLGMEETISDIAYFKAVNDRTYLHNLLCSKGTPFLEALLKNTNNYYPNKYINNKEAEDITQPNKILLRFAKSMMKWGKSGFVKVDEETYNRRLTACVKCNMLSSVPDKFLYKLVTDKHSNTGICASCGCIVSKKALLATDTCPEKHPEKPGMNRWGEPISNS